MTTFSPIPLTTVFTPPSTCASLTNAGGDQYYHAYNPSVTTGAWTSCYPSGFTHASTSGFLTDSYFSPGICPSGFTMCNSECISNHGEFWGLSLKSETGGRCCLSNWSTVPYKGYCTTVISGSTITALGIEVRWKATDLSLYDPNSPGMAKQVSTTAAPPMTTVITSTVTASHTGERGLKNLGTGAEVGLAVGLTMLVLIILISITAFLCLRKRRFSDKRTEAAAGSASGEYEGPIEMAATPQMKTRAVEVDSNPLSELA